MKHGLYEVSLTVGAEDPGHTKRTISNPGYLLFCFRKYTVSQSSTTP
ncbi:hypothetical protein KNP414_01730 [Paenibacillus mucilaginosus KNP414]|uniref:Uncharacterized protein n=1 Tax=Paenibacillus mucilaginosus (strain KNP414) TaxID=1036673 RepID=F8FQ72_PAEMK|nr:hypothetical protein KNP414_01730 [Paenibacillus mucilaginosus KNP414]